MKKTVIILAAAVLVLSLTGCSKYVSSYKAVGFVHSNEQKSSYMSFYSFEGRMVFRLKSTKEGDVKFTARLESGNATVWYDYNGTKSELFKIGAGESYDSHGGYVETGTVYIIVETDGNCKNGEFRFGTE